MSKVTDNKDGVVISWIDSLNVMSIEEPSNVSRGMRFKMTDDSY